MIESKHAAPIAELCNQRISIRRADLLLIRRLDQAIVLRHVLTNGYVARESQSKTSRTFELHFDKISKQSAKG